jgi:hypothetical protein
MAAGVSAATSLAIGAFVTNALIVGGISAAAGMATSALHGGAIDPGRTVNFRQPAAPRRVIYGQVRIGSVPTFIELSPATGHPKQYLVMVQTLAGHAISKLVGVRMDGLNIFWGSFNSNPGMPQFYEESGLFAGQIWLDWKLGQPGEPAFPGVVAITTRDGTFLWTTAHRQDGCASVALVFSYNPNVFPNGLPAISFDVWGKSLYDPRTNTTQFSDNVALAIYDYLTNKEYGLGADPSEINTASFIAAAYVCDELVMRNIGSNESRYSIGGMFSTDADPATILTALAGAMAGYVSYSQGQWYAIPGAWVAPTVTLTDDDMRGPMQVQTLRAKRDLCNAVQGTLFSEDQSYLTTNFPPVVHPRHICDDSGYPNAVQRGQWLTATDYNAGDCAIDSAPRIQTGTWLPSHAYATSYYVRDSSTGSLKIYVCTANHTSSIAGVTGNEPGVGATWTTYWVEVTATYSEFRGGVYICTVSHTSSALTEPGVGANAPTVWVEAKEYIWKDLNLNFTTSTTLAQRIAKIELERTRHQTTATMKCKLGAFQLQPGDTFYFSHPRYGWVNEVFMVLQSDFVIDDQGGGPVLGIDLRVQLVTPDIYAWNAATEEQALDQASQPTIPDAER